LFIHNVKEKICSAKVTNGLKILAKSLLVQSLAFLLQLPVGVPKITNIVALQ
jgi:hypothetical protein